MRFSTLMHRLPVTAVATALLLGAAITPAGAQAENGVYTVDDVTNTGPQVFGAMQVGINANGTLNVFDGRLVTSTSTVDVGVLTMLVPNGASGVVNVIGNHSRLEIDNTLRLAVTVSSINTVAGSLNVGAGGHVRAQTVALSVGSQRTTATVTVSGPGSLLETSGAFNLSERTANQIVTLTIGPGGTIAVGTIIQVFGSPTIVLDGGTLSLTDPSALPPSGIIQFNSGSLRFRSSQTLAAGTLSQFYGNPPVLGTGRGLAIDGTTTLATALRLDGGSLRTTRLAVDPASGSVIFDGGTLTLTGDGAVIDDGGDFGPDPLTVGDGAGAAALLELGGAGDLFLGAVTVAADGALNFGGESLIVDSLHNDGSISIADATLDVRGGLLNAGSLSLADAVVEGDVTSPAGATIDVAGTVIFNGNYSGAAAFYGSGTVVFNGTLSVD